MGGTVRRRRFVRRWWRRLFLATENREQTNDESTATPRAQVRRHHHEVPSVRFSRRRVSTRVIDPIVIGWVGHSRSHEVILVDSVFHQGPPRLAKSTVTLLGAGTRRTDGRALQTGEEL